jgi:hypothetical protein
MGSEGRASRQLGRETMEVAGRGIGLWKPPARGRGGGGRRPVEEAAVGGGMEEAAVGGGMEEAAFYPLENEDRGSILW